MHQVHGSTRLLFFCLASALLVLGNALQVCMVYDPSVVEIETGDYSAEGSNMLAGAEYYNLTLTLLTNVSSLSNWNEALSQCGVLIQPEPEMGYPLPNNTEKASIIALLKSWVTQGGVLVSCGGTIDFLNEVFGWSYSAGEYGSDIPDAFPRSNTAVPPFTDGPLAVGDWDGSYPPQDFPAEECQYVIPNTTDCAISLTRFKEENGTSPLGEGGAIIFFAWDFYGAFPVPGYSFGGDDYLPLLFENIISEDCNDNNIVDWLEISSDAALDCDENGVLDSCQIAANPALDCDENGVLDVCQPQPVKCVGESSSVSHTSTSGDGDGDGESDAASSLQPFYFSLF